MHLFFSVIGFSLNCEWAFQRWCCLFKHPLWRNSFIMTTSLAVDILINSRIINNVVGWKNYFDFLHSKINNRVQGVSSPYFDPSVTHQLTPTDCFRWWISKVHIGMYVCMFYVDLNFMYTYNNNTLIIDHLCTYSCFSNFTQDNHFFDAVLNFSLDLAFSILMNFTIQYMYVLS